MRTAEYSGVGNVGGSAAVGGKNGTLGDASIGIAPRKAYGAVENCQNAAWQAQGRLTAALSAGEALIRRTADQMISAGKTAPFESEVVRINLNEGLFLRLKTRAKEKDQSLVRLSE